MKVLVTGGRKFDDRDWLWAGLDLLSETIGGITEIIEGGAMGADVRAHEWALRRGVNATTVEALWDIHGKSAGYIRNSEMADLKPDFVLACPGGKGTTNMVDIANKRGIKVIYLEKMPVIRRGPPKEPPEIIIDAAA